MFLWVGMVGSVSIARESDRLWEAALEAFSRQAWDEGILLLDSLERAGWWSPELDYNRGTAWLHEGELGRAVLYLERARLWRPADPGVRHNLLVARNSVDYPYPPLFDFFLWRWWKGFSNLFTSDGWAVWTIACAWLVLTFFALGMHRRRRAFKMWAGVVFVGFLLSFAAGWTRYRLETNHPGVVVMRDAVVRVGASADAPEMMQLPEGLVLKRIDRIGEWVKVVLPDGRAGWMREGDLGFVAYK